MGGWGELLIAPGGFRGRGSCIWVVLGKGWVPHLLLPHEKLPSPEETKPPVVVPATATQERKMVSPALNTDGESLEKNPVSCPQVFQL